jgi:hypothetical protein
VKERRFVGSLRCLRIMFSICEALRHRADTVKTSFALAQEPFLVVRPFSSSAGVS